jgi:general stress protein 26
MESTREKISNYLTSRPYLNLATVTSERTPVVHTVGFVSEGATVWFMTDRTSRKAVNMMSNPAVAYAVDEDHTKLGVIQGVQMEGTASLVTDEGEMQKVFELMGSKFPQIKDIPDSPNYVIFKVEPRIGYFLDNTVEFGHRDRVVY